MAFFNVREKIVYKPMAEYPGYRSGAGSRVSSPALTECGSEGYSVTGRDWYQWTHFRIDGVQPGKWYYVFFDVPCGNRGYGYSPSLNIEPLSNVGSCSCISFTRTSEVFAFKALAGSIIWRSLVGLSLITRVVLLQDIHPVAAN